MHGSDFQLYWVFVSCQWGWWSPSGPLGNFAPRICSPRRTEEREGLEELSTYRASQLLLCMKLPTSINADIYLFHFTFKVYCSYDITRQEWEAFLSSADLRHREIHAHRLHPNGWPGLSAVWFGFQETTVSEETVLAPFFNSVWMFLLYRQSIFTWVARNI